MNAVTTIVSDVVEYVLRLFRGNKDELNLVEGEEIIPEEEVAIITDENIDPLQSQKEIDSTANRELLELDSEEANINSKPKNETDPDTELINLTTENIIPETPLDITEDGSSIEPINRNSKRLPEDSINRDQANGKNAKAPEKPKTNNDDGLDDLAEQSISEQQSVPPERKDTLEIDNLAAREIITPNSFVTSDEPSIQEAITVETTHNPSMPDKLMDAAPLEMPLEGADRFDFGADNELSIGSISMDEPITTGVIMEDFHATGANDQNHQVAEVQATAQMAAGQDFTQPKLDVADTQPAAATPSLGG